MRKLLFALNIALLLTFQANAQDGKATKDDYDRFFKTKTLVVLQDNPMLSYNFEIREVIKTEWNLTEFYFIEMKDFEAKRMDPQYSFLMILVDGFQQDKTKAKYQFLHLLMGGNYLRINQMPDLVSIPLSYEGVAEETYDFKLNSMVRFMQSHVKLISENPDYIGRNSFKYYKDNVKDIKTKTLYLVQDELAPEINTPAKIKKIYPYSFKIVSREEVEKAIADRDENVVYLHKVGPSGTKLIARCYKILMGANEPTLYYFDYHMIENPKKPDGFLSSDLKNIAAGKLFILF